MNERYKIINECDYGNIWYKDFPAQLEKTRVLFDSATDKIVIQFKLRNISNKTIDTTYLKIVCNDVSGQEIAVIDEHIMPMLAAGVNSNYGDKNPLFAEDKRISSVSAFITKVVFSDGTTWDNSALETGVEVEPAKVIPFTGALQEQFLRSTAHINEKVVMFEEHNDYWRCTCGRINLSNSDKCDGCNVKKTDLKQFFSSDYLSVQLDEYNEKQEIARKDSIYSEALALSNQHDITNVEKAKAIFLSINEWKDSADKIAQCEQRISELKDEQEKQCIEYANKAKKAKIISATVAAIALLGSAFAVLCVNVIIPNTKYNNAISLMESGQYDEAYSAFVELGDYSNATEQLLEVRYRQACSYLDNKDFDNALKVFSQLGSYSDAPKMVNECQYRKAITCIEEGEYYTALSLLRSITGYLDADEQIKICQYNQTIDYIENNDFKNAFEKYKEIGDFNNLEDRLWSSCYDYAQKLYDQNEYISAYDHFKMIENYRDCSEKLLELINKDHILYAMCADVGDIIEYGHYEQDGDSKNGSEPIEWIVLDKQGDRVLVLSKDCFLSCNYKGYDHYDWSESEARDYLNSLYSVIFSKAEKEYVITTRNWSNEDHLFLLSNYQTSKYLDDSQYLVPEFSELVAERSDSIIGVLCMSVSIFNNQHMYYDRVGKVCKTYDQGVFALRPAMWLDFG